MLRNSLIAKIAIRDTNPVIFFFLHYSTQLWVVLSNVYGQLIVVLTIALCLAEVMDTPVPLLSLQVSNDARARSASSSNAQF